MVIVIGHLGKLTLKKLHSGLFKNLQKNCGEYFMKLMMKQIFFALFFVALGTVFASKNSNESSEPPRGGYFAAERLERHDYQYTKEQSKPNDSGQQHVDEQQAKKIQEQTLRDASFHNNFRGYCGL